ncbi:MAG: cold shock domain-containing protein [Pseudonocardia sp.]|nr:cold shock domain-containing protein [Pseudonocardia sp.]
MVTGKVLRYDHARGYGFVAPEIGGDDVFIHVNDFEFDKALVGPGARLEFEIEESGRGLKASNIQLVERAPASVPRASLPMEPHVRAVDDGLCDVLTAKEFTEEVTECLLTAAPTMQASEIMNVRQHLVRMAHGHGWIEN